MRTFFRLLLHWLVRPHSILVTIVLFLFIGALDLIRFNLHFLDPFNNGLKDYEVTDIVFSRLQDNNEVKWCDEVVLVNTGQPDREKLIGMLRRLHDFRPRSIGLDILFEEDKEDDTILARDVSIVPEIELGEGQYYYSTAYRTGFITAERLIGLGEFVKGLR